MLSPRPAPPSHLYVHLSLVSQPGCHLLQEAILVPSLDVGPILCPRGHLCSLLLSTLGQILLEGRGLALLPAHSKSSMMIPGCPTWGPRDTDSGPAVPLTSKLNESFSVSEVKGGGGT